MKADQRNQAIALFLGGKSQRQIVSDLGVSKSSICRWSKSDDWVQRREEHRQQIISNILLQNTRFETQRHFQDANRVEVLLRQALAELEAYSLGKITRRHLKFNTKDILKLTQALTEAHSLKLKRGR